MKLATKLVFLLVVGMVLIVAVEAYISIHRDIGVFQDDLVLSARQLGRTLAVLVKDVWEKSGRDRALQLIDEADQAEEKVDVRWVWLDAKPGEAYSPQVSPDRLSENEVGERLLFQGRDAAGRPIMCFYEPVNVDPARRGALELSLPANAVATFERETVVSAATVAGSVIVISAVLAVLMGMLLIARPLHLLIDKTRRIGAGDLSDPMVIRSRDEFAELADAINKMCDQLALTRDRLQTETEARVAAIEQLEHADRLATVGRLAAGMAHELGTPMNVVSARAGSIVDEAPSEEIKTSATVIRTQIDRMTAIIRQLLAFARRQNLRKTQVDTSALLAQSIDLLAALAKKRNVVIQLAPDSQNLFVEADGGQLQQVLINLLTNAIDAMPNGGTVATSVAHAPARQPETTNGPPGDYARIDVQDEGTGISDDDLRRIFDPFFTTKEVGKGTGLGLSIAFGIVREHGGWIDVSSRVGEGSCFSVYLPLPRAVEADPEAANEVDRTAHVEA